MKKATFIANFAKETGESQKKSAVLVEGFLNTITKGLADGEEIQFRGWGTFTPKKTPQRTARNPKTQEPVIVPERIVAKFKAGNKLKEALNK